MTAIGVAKRRDLILAINAHFGDKTMMADLVEQAMEAAEAGAAATSGTALHELLDAYDQGRTPTCPTSTAATSRPTCEATAGWSSCARRRSWSTTSSRSPAPTTTCGGSRLRPVAESPDGRTERLPAGTLLIGDKKGLALTTPLPTPTRLDHDGRGRGWRPGHSLLTARPCMVTEKSQVKRIGTYIVTFDDGSQVTCDSEHIWWVNGGGHGAAHKQTRPVGIEEIRANFRSNQGQCWWRVPMPEPVRCADREAAYRPLPAGLLAR
jgi:hypothetical protein